MVERTGEAELRDLIGLRGKGTWYFLAILEVTIGLYMVPNFDLVSIVPATVGLILVGGAGLVTLLVPGNPLPVSATCYVVVVGPVSVASTTLGVIPVEQQTDGSRQVWTAFACCYVLAVLVLRGRMGAAWLGLLVTGATLVTIVVVGELDVGVVTRAVVAVATVAGVSVCALIMRPTQHSLRLLSEEAAMRAAAEATMAAENEERDRQLYRLDKLAGPILERVASGAELSEVEREQCRLLEAELRDGLRAPQLATEQLSSAARGARARGVEVVLLDDGGFNAVSRQISEQVIAVAVRELDGANSGSVTIRVLPAGRRLLATVLVDAPQRDRRTEIDVAGTVTVGS